MNRTVNIPTVDNASLIAFRVLFGLVAIVSTSRFLLNGWLERCFVEPTYFFTYYGFDWVVPLTPLGMRLLFAAMLAGAVGITVGLFYRFSAVLFFATFTYVELIDVTNYLNHYYLVSLLAFLCCWAPLHRRFSLDALRRPRIRSNTIGAHYLWWFRFQVGCVYFFAGIAKCTSDWLLHAQPLRIWLRSRVDTPLIGPLFEFSQTAYLMSWAGCLFDLTIVGWLLWSKTRIPAYIVVIGFHTVTGLLFNIGMFPWIMIVCATIFFSPSWPPIPKDAGGEKDVVKVPAIALILIACWCLFHVSFPLRTFTYGDDVLWHEQGMRWSWRVMVREKAGSISYRVVDHDTGRTRYVKPSELLTRHQAREMSGQPDLIMRLGKEIGSRQAGNVSVYARAKVSLNGRKPVPMVDPNLDLMTFEDGTNLRRWVLDNPISVPR